MYRRALAGKEKALVSDHTSTLDTVHNIGLLYSGQGKLKEAGDIYQRALAGYERVLGPNHNRTRRLVDRLITLSIADVK
jgi:tetratricopeptide (TPR) repeat protein